MWKDTTSYHQGDKERKPTAFTAKSGDLAVTVTCNHIDYRGDWVMHCFKLGINTKHLHGCKSLDEAKLRAVEIVRNEANKISESAAALDA